MRVDTAEFIRSAHRSGDFLHDGRPEVAFAGRSNVGKSSLMNRLLGRKALARTSSTPGRTRSVNYFSVNDRFYFVDLPGYGYAKAGRDERREWAEVVNTYLQQALPRLMMMLLVDAKVGATPLDRQAADYLRGLGVPLVVAATKVDRLPRGRSAATMRSIREVLDLGAGIALVPVSAQTGDGIRQLWSAIDLHLEARA